MDHQHISAPSRAPITPAVARLHELARADYAKGTAERATPTLAPSYAAISLARHTHTTEPSDLDVAIRVAQQLLGSDQVPSLREALRLLLRAIGAEPTAPQTAPAPPTQRCAAAHPEDPTACSGPTVVTVLASDNSGLSGCEHHGARLLASLEGGRVYALPDAPAGAAIRTFKAAATTLPYAWVQRGEGQ